jgi:hypothetical protein
VILPVTLGANLGLATQAAPRLRGVSERCGGLSIQACITFGAGFLGGGANGVPNGGLFGVTQHEVDEVLGTASNLSRTEMPISPAAADLFRYGAPGVRSWSLNSVTTQDCGTNTPAAYASVNGGQTNLASYNNCNNGGDYGDFVSPANMNQVQDAFGNPVDPSLITLRSPEASLLDAIGWNFTSSTVVASGTPTPVTEQAIFVGQQLEGVPAPAATPEPATFGLAGGVLTLLLIARRRSTRS